MSCDLLSILYVVSIGCILLKDFIVPINCNGMILMIGRQKHFLIVIQYFLTSSTYLDPIASTTGSSVSPDKTKFKWQFLLHKIRIPIGYVFLSYLHIIARDILSTRMIIEFTNELRIQLEHLKSNGLRVPSQYCKTFFSSLI